MALVLEASVDCLIAYSHKEKSMLIKGQPPASWISVNDDRKDTKENIPELIPNKEISLMKEKALDYSYG